MSSTISVKAPSTASASTVVAPHPTAFAALPLRTQVRQLTTFLHSKLDSSATSVSLDPNDIAQLMEMVKKVEVADANEPQRKRKPHKGLRRKMSAFDLDKEFGHQTEAIGYDLDDSTVKHVQHFTGMVEQDGVRHSSAHLVARLKHKVKHTLVQKALTTFGSDHMIRLLKEQEYQGSHKLHTDLDNINEWGDFNIFHLLETFNGDRGLTVRSISVEIIEARHNLLTQLGINQPVFLNYINKVCETYNKVPYHNCIHGGDVLQGFHCLLMRSPVLRKATPHNMMFACLMAALVHDVGHVGRTNHFLVNTEHGLALQYNDQSVLENMHIAKALELTKATACNIFEHFGEEDRKEVRSVWITMILGTDMAHHVRGVYELTLAINKAKDIGEECVMITPKKHVTTLGYLLHACDLSNPTKPFPIYNEWTGRVMQEFFEQSSAEKEKGISVTLPERETANIPAFQIGFIRFIRPFFAALNEIQDIDMSEQLKHLGSNLDHWIKERKKCGSASSVTASATATVTASVAASAASNKKTPPLGIHILQAQWGTNTKYIDVTEQVQELIVKDPDTTTTTTTRFTLSIPKSLNFNKMFGDPAMFRRKYLRIVALVDGEPNVNAIYELRKKDFILKSGRGGTAEGSETKESAVDVDKGLDEEFPHAH